MGVDCCVCGVVVGCVVGGVEVFWVKGDTWQMATNLHALDVEKLREVCGDGGVVGERARRKLAVLERDGFVCVRCGASEELTIDHKKGFRAKGRGPEGYVPEQCQTLCVECHVRKNIEVARLREDRRLRKEKRRGGERVHVFELVGYCNMRVARLFEHISVSERKNGRENAGVNVDVLRGRIRELRLLKGLLLDGLVAEEIEKLRAHKVYVEGRVGEKRKNGGSV